MLKRILLILIAAGAVVACEKPAEQAPEEPAAVEETAESEDEAEPTTAAESAANDKPANAKEPGSLAEDLKPGEEGFYGAKFTVIEPAITLAKALEQAPEHAGPMKVEATVAKVCKKKGCWFTMSDGSTDQEIRVRMKDYGFFVPRNADGARVVAEGTLTSREVPQEEAQHYADDEAEAGEEPRKVEGPQQVWEFTATAIQINASEG